MEPQRVWLDLFPAASGLPQDGQNCGAVVFHMLLECLPQADTLGVAAPTHKHHIQMLPDMVQPCFGVIVSNATVGAKGDLPPLPSHHQGYPSQARPSVKARQHELLVHAEGNVWGYDRHQAGRLSRPKG